MLLKYRKVGGLRFVQIGQIGFTFWRTRRPRQETMNRFNARPEVEPSTPQVPVYLAYEKE